MERGRTSNGSEFGNYCRRLKSPQFLYRALIALVSPLILALLRRVCPDWIRSKSIPVTVARIRTRLLHKSENQSSNCYYTEPSACSIKLAIGRIEFKSSNDWKKEFADPEVTVSLHRWGWLLRGITDDERTLTYDQGLALMRSWLQSCILDETFGADPYSTSERIVNASIFIINQGGKDIPEDILSAFRFMMRQIACNLEYYEGERTGNHALNNGRGLFFAGVLTNSPDAIALAFAIFQERLPNLVTGDGFLRESSSHYHFLFTRWILEIHWLAVLNSQEDVAKLIAPYATRLVERCWFFLVKDDANDTWSMPLIGDISPDFPPDWLLALPWSRPALAVYRPKSLPSFKGCAGWASLFGVEEGTSELSPVGHSLTFPKSLWHRMVRDESTLFVHAEATDGRLRADHRHLDLGGFVLYRSGSLVFADSGRIDYTLTALSRYGKGAASHSTIFIDGLPPAADGPSWFQKNYKAVDVKTELREADASTVFTLQHNGFDRLGSNAFSHERRFILTPISFEIEDRLFGATSHNVRLRFHLSPGLVLEKRQLTSWSVMPLGARFLTDQRLQNKVVSGQTSNPINGIYSGEYGVSEACTTLELDGDLLLPCTIINRLTWN
jgi:hypothetical protein